MGDSHRINFQRQGLSNKFTKLGLLGNNLESNWRAGVNWKLTHPGAIKYRNSLRQ